MFTARNDDRIEKDIGEDIGSILAAVERQGVSYDAIYLVGSFGRGEGSAYFDGHRWRGLNDYDLLIVSSGPVSNADALKRLGQELAKRLQMDFIDIGWLPRSALRQLSPTIENYDLKNASLRLAGRDVLEEIPTFDVKEIPPFEFARLICNRTAGVLSSRLPLRARSPQYCANQYVKACVAVGDVAVYLGENYHPSYQERQKLFLSLAKKDQIPFLLSDDAIAFVISAYSNKLGNETKEGFRIDDILMREMIKSAFLAIAARCLGEQIDSIRTAEEALVKHYRNRRTLVERIDDFVCIWLRHDKSRASTLRYKILFSLPAVYSEYPSTTFHRWLSHVSRFWLVPGALNKSGDLASVVSLWEEYCH
jgi:predicted nucleotidyltransferase